MKIRDANEADFEDIVHLNAAEELQKSQMPLKQIQVLDGLSCYHKAYQPAVRAHLYK
jgi:hypothetical protein